MTLPVSQELLQDVAAIAGMRNIEECAHVLANSIIQKANPAEISTFLAIAKQYKLNPLTKEIYAFPGKSGGIQPIVSIDGWLKIINSHPQYNGMEFSDSWGDDGNIRAITCRIYRKDREHPTETTEYLAECQRNTDPWEQWPVRMLRHKATIQAARYAFGFSGIYDQDEADRIDRIDNTQQPKPVQAEVLADAEQLAQIHAMARTTGAEIERICAAYKVESLDALSQNDADRVIRQLAAKQAKAQAKAQTQEEHAAPPPAPEMVLDDDEIPV